VAFMFHFHVFSKNIKKLIGEGYLVLVFEFGSIRTLISLELLRHSFLINPEHHWVAGISSV